MVPENEEKTLRKVADSDIPHGEDLETVKARARLIRQFYAWWMSVHPERKVFNVALGEDIHVTYNSKQETSRQAARRYESTLATLRLDIILRQAVPILSSPADRVTKAQKRFERMLLMKCECDGIGTVKLTVGVTRSNKTKEQYCITAIETDFSDAFRQSPRHGDGSRKKKNRRKADS